MKKMMVYLGMLWMTIPAFVNAQVSADSTDQDLINSIAAYPKDVRTAILEVAQYPQVLVKLERIQSRSSQSFQDIISGYSRSEQESFYEISRYPDRLDLMVRDGQKSDDQVRRYLEDLPSTAQSRIMDGYHRNFNVLRKMNVIYKSSQEAMDKVLEDYPANIQSYFRKVVSEPDVMNLLTDNIDFTMGLGQDYKSNPAEVTTQLDQLSAQIATDNEQNLAAYKSQVESNPEMQNEMKQAADNFSSSYTQDAYPGSVDPNPTVINNNYYNYNPYPYWFSYPYWYTTAIWYPRPYYYYTGFYYGPGGNMIVCGWPNRVYSSWFIHAGYYRSYPHLYSHYSSYYHHYPRNNYFAGRYNGTSYNHYNRSRSSSYRRDNDQNRSSSYRHDRSVTNGNRNNSVGSSNLIHNYTPNRHNRSNSNLSNRSQQLGVSPSRPSNWTRSGSVSQSRSNFTRTQSTTSSGSRGNSNRGGGNVVSGGHTSGGHSSGGHSSGGHSSGGHSSGGHSGGGHSGSGGGRGGRGH